MSRKNDRQKPGALVISLDFELFWGVADFAQKEEWAPVIHRVHEVVPRLLSLFEEYGVHATWATVGAITCKDNQDFMNLLPIPTALQTEKLIEKLQLNIEENDTATDKMLFAPELVEMIHNFEGQEIGTHTFSHYYCDDESSNPSQFYRELMTAQEIAKAHGYPFSSAVFPRNQVSDDYVAEIKKTAILCYRGVESGWIAKANGKLGPIGTLLWYLDNYIPLQRPCSYSAEDVNHQLPVNIRNSRFFKPFRPKYKLLEGLKIKKYCYEMEFAARHGEIYHIYWHPHNFAENTEINFQQMRTLLSHYSQMRDKYGMRSFNMSEAFDLITQ